MGRRRAGFAVAAALLCSGGFVPEAGNTVSAYTANAIKDF
jgi:hypothetical protein